MSTTDTTLEAASDSSSMENRKFPGDNKEFKSLLNEIKADFAKLLKITTYLAVLDKGDFLQYENGKRLGKREFNSLHSTMNKKVDFLAKCYADSKKKKIKKKARTNSGFNLPMYITSNMQQFFAGANLGPAYVVQRDSEGKVIADTFQQDASAEGLRGHLKLLCDYGITSKALLTPLFNVYSAVNDMQDPENKQFNRATPQMRQHFKETFDALYQSDVREPKITKKVQKAADGSRIEVETPKEPFNPDHFIYAGFNRIVSLNSHSKELLTEEQAAELAKPELRQRLEDERRIVSDTLAFYRTQKEADKKARAKETRSKKSSSKASAVAAGAVAGTVSA